MITIWVEWSLWRALVGFLGYLYKSTKKSWQGSDPPLFGNARILRAPVPATPPKHNMFNEHCSSFKEGSESQRIGLNKGVAHPQNVTGILHQLHRRPSGLLTSGLPSGGQSWTGTWATGTPLQGRNAHWTPVWGMEMETVITITITILLLLIIITW